MVSVINNFGGFYKTEFYFHEARMSGAFIEAPCVNNSESLTTVYDKTIYIGFVHLKSLETKLGQQIAENRMNHGPYKSFEDFLTRVPMGLEQLRILVRVGAFRFTGKDKQRLLWESMLFYSNAKTKTNSTNLFDTAPTEYPLPQLSRNWSEDAFDELELLGFPLCDPFKLLSSQDRGDTTAATLLTKVEKPVHIIGYVVTTKDTRTKSNETMHFGTFLDKDGEVFDTVHFPDIARKFPFRGRGFYSIHGKVVSEFGVAMIEVTHMQKVPMIHKRAEEFMREPIELREKSKVANSVS
jgi:DNA polymerase-3 subunit alpha